MLTAESGDLEAATAEIEGHDVGVGLVGRVRAHARTGKPGFDLARDDRQRHARDGAHLLRESLPVGTFADGARTEDRETRRSLSAGEIEQPSDRRGGGFLRLEGQGVTRMGILLEADRFGQAAQLGAVGLVHDGDLDGIRPYVDDGDGGHVQKRN